MANALSRLAMVSFFGTVMMFFPKSIKKSSLQVYHDVQAACSWLN